MCGIVGYAFPRGADRLQLLEAQRDTLAHRGPDDRGIWVSVDGCVGFGHRRLAIIDLSSRAHQPMTRKGDSYCVTFNGEIYNFMDLRDELRTLGHEFSSSSDTEVLLAAYREWGIDCLSRLNGMFAFALYDAAKRVVWLARDRAGEKPLFYTIDSRGLQFASELKALLADPLMPRTLDQDALAYYFAFGYVPGSHCLVSGARKLAPGTLLRFDVASGAHSLARYWELPSAPQSPIVPTEELTDELETLLADAVRRQLIGDVPTGILLSGGTDSSIVAALAARVVTGRLRTYTVSFPGYRQFDEAPFARQVADHLGSEHVEIAAEEASVDILPRLARQFDEPIADSSMIPTFMVAELIRRHATVAIGGDGGDELFGGYPHHSWAWSQEAVRQRIPGFARSFAARLGRALPVGTRGRNQLIGVGGTIEESIGHVNVYFDRAARRRLGHEGASPSPEQYKAALCAPGESASRSTTRVDFQTFMVDDVLTKVDRASMLASLEVRAPFLDFRVIEFAFGRVPDALRATSRERKVLLRLLAARLLPASLPLRRKQGFSIPLSSWFTGAWGAFVRDVLASAPAALIPREEVASLLRGQELGLSNEHRLFALVMLELWRAEYGISLS